MRYLFVLTVLLAGCTHTITLYPRGGGDPSYGTLGHASRYMQVTIGGESYAGTVALPQTVGVTLVPTTSPGGVSTLSPVTSVGHSTNASALLTGRNGTLRCAFIFQSGGNGVCVDSKERAYDLLMR